jgi:ABC-type branched-subunit amino acid transport system substrate-binding protein
MSGPTRDDESPDYSRFAPKRFREQPPASTERPYVPSAPTVPAPRTPSTERRAASDFPSWPEPVPEPPPPPHRLEDGPSALIGRVALVVTFAAVVALVLIFARPISQGAHALVDATSRLFGSSKSTDLLTAGNASSSESTGSPTRTASASVAAPVPAPVAQPAPAAAQPAAVAQTAPTTVAQASSGGQQLSLSTPSQPLGQEPSGPKVMVRGISDNEIRFGMSAPFSGANKELGQNMRLGIEAAFNAANSRGGVNGRQLKLVAADDGYEPTRTADTMKRLYEKDQVFAVVGNVGTPTAAVALPYALDRKMIFFGAFTGAGLLRSDPPDRYVFNYRASYAEETAATVNYLVKVKRLKPSQIAVFAQQDAYGDAGFSGVARAIRALGGDENSILRLHYQRNTVDVDDAVDQLRKSRVPIRAVVMVPGYRAAAKFIEKTRDLFPGMIYTSVSFVGSTALANELMLLGKKYASGVIVTQVVPALDGHSSLVLDYKAALAKYFPGEQPDYVSLEGYVAANVLITALRRNGPDLDTEKLVTTLENLRDLDIGLGTPVSFGRSEHQGVHKVWGTQIDENGRYQPIDLQ